MLALAARGLVGGREKQPGHVWPGLALWSVGEKAHARKQTTKNKTAKNFLTTLKNRLVSYFIALGSTCMHTYVRDSIGVIYQTRRERAVRHSTAHTQIRPKPGPQPHPTHHAGAGTGTGTHAGTHAARSINNVRRSARRPPLTQKRPPESRSAGAREPLCVGFRAPGSDGRVRA